MKRRLDLAGALVRALVAREGRDPPAGWEEALALLEDQEIAVAVLDAPGRTVRLASGSWRAWFGAGGELFPAPHIDQVIRTGAALHLSELVLAQGGPPARCAATMVPIGGAAGATTGVIVLCALFTNDRLAHARAARAEAERDRAEQERAELVARERAARADAEQARWIKDRFLSAVSHELRAPLTTILLWEKVLRDEATHEEPPSALRAQALDAIRQSALSQSRLISDLLDLSRALSGKLHVALRPQGLERELRAALEAIAPAAEARQIVLDRRGAPVEAEVLADGARLRQVLDSLLDNAVKFTEPGGRVTLAVTRREGTIAIAIEDTGRGIAPERLPSVFEPFRRIEGTSTRVERGEGIGIGLAIARQLAALHRGELAAASEGPGRGSTFTLTLPIATEARAGAPEIERELALAEIRVLVIDDEPRVCRALALLLRRAGAVVDTAESAEAARVQIALQPPEVIVCDVTLQAEDGNSFIARLRAAGQAIPAIALTAYALEADVKRALAAGFDVHLAKPVDFARLAERIGALAAGRRATSASR
jgi:signal transduction histidine kinase/ActR/RegA family two-component response regulator